VSSIQIVIVEDNPADVLLFREALKGQGLSFSLEHHSNGEEAARAIGSMTKAPHLFVLDLNVPRVHGFELLRIIRREPVLSPVPVAILTSSQSAEDKLLSERNGADAYIVKPPGYHEFVADVGAAIGHLVKGESRGVCCLSARRRRPMRAVPRLISDKGLRRLRAGFAHRR
jgi:two-component system, chemotaxis family, response regulator Rcp1